MTERAKQRTLGVRVQETDEARAITALGEVEGVKAATRTGRTWLAPEGWVVIEASKTYPDASLEPFVRDTELIEDALRQAGIVWEIAGGSSTIAGGMPDSRWVDAVHVETGERYGRVVGRDRDEALEQLTAVSDLYGVPIEKLTVLPPID